MQILYKLSCTIFDNMDESYEKLLSRFTNFTEMGPRS